MGKKQGAMGIGSCSDDVCELFPQRGESIVRLKPKRLRPICPTAAHTIIFQQTMLTPLCSGLGGMVR